MSPTPAAARIETLSEEELYARRQELAEQVNPLLMRLEALDDELMARRRAERRERILAPPPQFDVEEESHSELSSGAIGS